MNINIIIIICLILIIFFLQNKLGILKTFIESFENIPIDIGNHLSDYFYNLGTSILQKTNFSYTVPDTDLFRHLPSNIKYSDINTEDTIGNTANISFVVESGISNYYIKITGNTSVYNISYDIKYLGKII